MLSHQCKDAPACRFHLETNRPTAGNIILCAAHPDNDFDSDLSTAVRAYCRMFHCFSPVSHRFACSVMVSELLPGSIRFLSCCPNRSWSKNSKEDLVCRSTSCYTFWYAYAHPCFAQLVHIQGGGEGTCTSASLQGMDASMFQGEHFINSAGEKLRREDILSLIHI